MAQVVSALSVDSHLWVNFQLELIHVIGKYLACFSNGGLKNDVSVSKQIELGLKQDNLHLHACFLQVLFKAGRNFSLLSSWQYPRSCRNFQLDVRRKPPQISCAKDMARRATAGLHEKSLD